jgi:Arc/MetJ-type ribon-helix-helix transcriptional regulator
VRRRSVADTEKITINLGAVDLGKIDLLVDQGLYSNRADLIRTAIRQQLERHADVVQQTVSRREMVVGVLVVGKKDLESRRARGERLRIGVVGMLVLSSDVDEDLARETIESIDLFGSFRASAAVKKALAGRVRQFATLYRGSTE